MRAFTALFILLLAVSIAEQLRRLISAIFLILIVGRVLAGIGTRLHKCLTHDLLFEFGACCVYFCFHPNLLAHIDSLTHCADELADLPKRLRFFVLKLFSDALFYPVVH